MLTITVNGIRREIQAPDDTPLLYVLRNDLELTGPQFGCGLAQCGACSVLIEGKEVRSCVTPISTVANQEITSLEGLPARWAKQMGLSAEDAQNTLHPVQQVWIRKTSLKKRLKILAANKRPSGSYYPPEFYRGKLSRPEPFSWTYSRVIGN